MHRITSRVSIKRAGTLILTAIILLTAFSNTAAVSANPRNASSGMWAVSITGLDGLVCVGDSYMLTAYWDTVITEGIAPLSGPTILVQATHGSFLQATERPGTISGTTYFNYKAEKPGTETVKIQLFNSDREVDAENTVSFEVKKCDYLYTLTSRVDAGTSGGELAFYYIIKSKGLLKAVDLNQPHKLEGLDKFLTIDTTIAFFESGECTLLSSDVGRAFGFVDAKAEDVENGLGIRLMLGPPKDLNYIHDLVLTCPDGPHPQNVTIPITSSKDPWIEQVFPLGEGEHSVKIDFLDEGMQRMRDAGNWGYYTATLSLQRVEGK